MRNVLLENENNRLREALINEKKKRQRGKALLLKAPPQYDGGAIFWSPNKVQEARDQQAQKDANEKALQQQKEEEQIRKEAEKAEKARMLEERKRTRAIAKEIKLQTAAEKQVRKLANKPSVLHKRDSKYKGKSKAITPETSTDEQEEDDEDSDEKSVVEMAGPTPARSRRTRHINLPERYRNWFDNRMRVSAIDWLLLQKIRLIYNIYRAVQLQKLWVETPKIVRQVRPCVKRISTVRNYLQ